MTNLLTLDTNSKIATVAMTDWPWELRNFLHSYFITDLAIEDWYVLQIDLSHLSTARRAFALTSTGYRSEYEIFVDKIGKAALCGRLELVISIVGSLRDALSGSSAVRDLAALPYPPTALIEQIFGKQAMHLAAIMIEEGSLNSTWLPSVLTSKEARPTFLRQEGITDAVFARVNDANGFWDALRLLQPAWGESGEPFGKAADLHWPYVADLISNHISDAESNKREAWIHLVASLFRYSKLVRASRWACELALAKADPTMLPALVAHCDQLTPDDLRTLLGRLREADRDTVKPWEAAAQTACKTLSRLCDETISTDIVLAGLWNGFAFDHGTEPTLSKAKLMESLRELPTGEWRDRDFWDQLGAEQREAWRVDLLETVGHDVELKHGLIDFACRWLAQVAFIEVEPVLTQLIDGERDLAAVRHLADHGPRLVELRAKGLLRHKLGIVADRFAGSDDASLPDVNATTWLGDPTTERVIHRLFARWEAEFCSDYCEEWGADEEVLTARFLAGAEVAARETTQQLRHLASTTKGRFPSLTVQVRQPGKAEEGSPTTAGAPLAADILFVTRILDKTKIIVERATLVQVKKRRARASGSFDARIAIDRLQCSDLLTQTEHAFYLFLTPPAPAPRLWVAPARLVRNLTELHDSRSSVAAVQARDASSSFADFFLHQLIGLWAGDEDKALLDIADGDARRGRKARYVVEIRIQRSGD